MVIPLSTRFVSVSILRFLYAHARNFLLHTFSVIGLGTETASLLPLEAYTVARHYMEQTLLILWG